MPRELNRILALSGLSEALQGYNLDAKYAEFNRHFYKGELPTIPVTWAKLKAMGGVAKARVASDPSDPKNMTVVPGSMSIVISDVYKRSEEGLDGILLHEMIHIHCYVIGRIKENHGPYFRSEARRIGHVMGFEIPLTDDVSNLVLATAKAKPVGVVVLERKQGGYAYALVSPNSFTNADELAENIWNRLDKSMVVGVRGYVVSSDQWTLMATRLPVQRNLANLKYYHLDMRPEMQKVTTELLRDLDGFGKIQFYRSIDRAA